MNAQDRIALMIGRLVIQTETLNDQMEALKKQVAENEQRRSSPPQDAPVASAN